MLFFPKNLEGMKIRPTFAPEKDIVQKGSGANGALLFLSAEKRTPYGNADKTI